MQIKPPEALAQMLIDEGFTAAAPIEGCTEADIVNLEKHFKIVLPQVYKNFLRVMGRQAGDFLSDGTWHYDDLEWVRDRANERVTDDTEDNSFKFAKSDFVFLSRLGDFFLYFNTEDGVDPAVFILEDGKNQPRRFFDSFSEWLTVCVTSDVLNRRKNKQLRTSQGT